MSDDAEAAGALDPERYDRWFEQFDVDGHGYKFVRDGLEFDVIAPEGLDARADLTNVPPLRAPQLAGTGRALDRTQRIAVDVDGRAAALPRPDLLGGLVVKACAAASDHVRGPQRHFEDLARLYRLVTDPRRGRLPTRIAV